MGDSTPRERRHQRTRESILDAAVSLIREKGADKLSLREIARRIDYSPAGLYEYFDSKEAIIEAVCLEANRRLGVYLSAVDTGLPPEEYMVALGLAYVQFARQNPEMFTMLFTNFNGPTEMVDLEQLDEDDAALSIAYQAMKRGIETGIFALPDGYGAMDLTYALWALVHGMAVMQVTYLRDLPMDFEHADRLALQTFVRGLMV